MEELNSGPSNTNPSSGRVEDLNPGPPDYKSSALTARPRSSVISVTASKLSKNTYIKSNLTTDSQKRRRLINCQD